MRIYALDLLRGKTPDPYYKNLFWFPDVCDPDALPSAITSATKNAIENIEGIEKTTIQILSTLQPDKTVYAIAETPTLCSIAIARPEIRSITELSDLAQYIIIHELQANGTTRTFSFWFVMNVSILSEGKFRLDLQRDEWASNWATYIKTPIQFTRRHVRRWRRITPGVESFAPVFNGLSDPVAESMVMSKTHDEPAPVFGSSRVYLTGVGYVRPVMLWRYIRFATDKFYMSGVVEDPPTAIKLKETIPSVAYPLGIIYRADDTSKTYFRAFEKINDGTSDKWVVFSEVMGIASSYIAESFLSTRPPCPFTWDTITTDGTTYLRAKAVTTAGNPVPTVYGSGLITYGGDSGADPPVSPVSLPGGMVYDVSTPGGSTYRQSFADSFTLAQDAAEFPQSETKIFEAPYSTKTLKIGTAKIDVSPAPGRETIVVEIPYCLGTSAIVKGDGKEIAEVPGWWSGMQSDTLTDALSEWLIANRNTYEMGRNWQLVNGITKGITAAAEGKGGGVIGSVLGIAQSETTNAARMADLANAPGSATLPTANGFDNLPFVDHPLLAITETIDEAKTKILQFWKRYGYPDNTTAAMVDAITRDEFVYMQGTPILPTPGILPPRQSWFNGAIGSGVYLWRIHDEGGTLSTSYGETNDPAQILNFDEV